MGYESRFQSLQTFRFWVTGHALFRTRDFGRKLENLQYSQFVQVRCRFLCLLRPEIDCSYLFEEITKGNGILELDKISIRRIFRSRDTRKLTALHVNFSFWKTLGIQVCILLSYILLENTLICLLDQLTYMATLKTTNFPHHPKKFILGNLIHFDLSTMFLSLVSIQPLKPHFLGWSHTRSMEG